MPDVQKTSSTAEVVERLPYQSPNLRLFGDLADLTQSGGEIYFDLEVGSYPI